MGDAAHSSGFPPSAPERPEHQPRPHAPLRLDRSCARALAAPDPETQADSEAAAVARYEALLAEQARDWWKVKT